TAFVEGHGVCRGDRAFGNRGREPSHPPSSSSRSDTARHGATGAVGSAGAPVDHGRMTTIADTLLARYGTAAPASPGPSNETSELLYRHRSLRRCTAAPIDDDTVIAVVAAAQSVATSSNFQSWSVIE